jgi:DNA invertase Pin-like site-specific DNA recombinase
LVYHVDRLTRGGPAHFAIIAARLAQHGVGLAFVLGEFRADSPEGILSVQLQSSIAWYENQMRPRTQCPQQAASCA